MICPSCGVEIKGRVCKECFGESPNEAVYCMYCGVKLSDGEEDLDLEDRVLCPDGNCTGIIENGVCTVCGRPFREA